MSGIGYGAGAGIYAFPGADGTPHVILALRACGSDAERARYLLRLSDNLTAEYQVGLAASCWQAGFTEGQEFVAIRVAALTANRNDEGHLPAETGALLIAQRGLMRAIAAGELAPSA